jgi:N-acetylglucosaminyldiphosphoundecaprenol N-acetyl-beta-D-mannosaminyltransferase
MERIMIQRERAQPLPARDTVEDEIELFNVRISNLSFDELCHWIDVQVGHRTAAYVVTPNIDHVCRLQRDSEFRDAYAGAGLRLVDSAPLMWFAKLFNQPLKEKLSGSDLVPRVSAFAAGKGYRVFLLGAAEGVADEAARRLQAKYPGLEIAGCYSPPFGFDRDAAQNEAVCERVREANADICFVALGSPKQEIWLLRHAGLMGVPAAFAVGAGVDFAAGRVQRAPVWMQRSGCEWLWRLMREPFRLWRRYLVEDSYFLVILLREIGRRLGRS